MKPLYSTSLLTCCCFKHQLRAEPVRSWRSKRHYGIGALLHRANSPFQTSVQSMSFDTSQMPYGAPDAYGAQAPYAPGPQYAPSNAYGQPNPYAQQQHQYAPGVQVRVTVLWSSTSLRPYLAHDLTLYLTSVLTYPHASISHTMRHPRRSTAHAQHARAYPCRCADISTCTHWQVLIHRRNLTHVPSAPCPYSMGR